MKLSDQRLDRLSRIAGLDLEYFVSGGFWIGLSLSITALGGIVLSSLFARIWPSDVYGQFSFLTAALGFLSLTVLPGMSQIVTQSAAEGKDGTYFAATKVLSRWSVIGTSILILGSLYFFLRDNPNLALATLLGAIAFPISSAASLYNSFLTGKKKFKMVAVFTTAAQLISIAATAFALIFLSGLVWVAMFSAWSTAVVNVVLTIFAQKSAENKSMDEKLLDFGKHLSFSQMLPIGADYFDRFIIPLLLGFSNNAVYAFAIMIPVQIHYFLKIFISLAQPKLSQLSVEGIKKDLVRQSLKLEILIIIIVILYIILAPIIFDVLYPAYKKDSLLLSQIFAISLLYFPANIFPLVNVKQRASQELYYSNTINAVFSILTVLILVYYFGLIGAVFAKIVSRFVQMTVNFYYFKKVL